MKILFSASLAILLLLLTLSHIEADVAPAAAPAPAAANSTSICDGKCGVRCSKASQEVRCIKYCGICCHKCDYCVPSGTAGNKDECPCYRDMKNSKGKSKCP